MRHDNADPIGSISVVARSKSPVTPLTVTYHHSQSNVEQVRCRCRCVSPYQSLVSERVVDASDEEPEGPQVLEPELKHKVRQQNQDPHHQELQVEEGAAGGGGGEIKCSDL